MLLPPEFKKNCYLKDFCTLNIGGPAAYFIEVQTADHMQEVIKICSSRRLRFYILGKGSNSLFSERGFNGVVILNKIHFLDQPQPGLYQVGAGYSFSLLGVQTARQGWTGLEFASGIPATVGGAVFMNAGANGTETCEHLVSVDFIDASGTLRTYSKSELSFSYRYSSFQDMGGAITSASFQLQPSSIARAKQLELIQYRQNSQPYKDKSAGCIFRNPEGKSAGTLIDACGLKGTKIGGAEISTKHANFIVNRQNANTEDILALISHVQTEVLQKFGCYMEPEVRVVPHYFSES